MTSRILVVDDDTALAEMIGIVLRTEGFETVFCADGAQAVGAGMLRGLQDTRMPMIFAAVGYWGIGLPLGAALAFGTSLRGIGIWIGLATGLAVVASLMMLRWLRRDRLGLVTEPPRQIESREAFAG